MEEGKSYLFLGLKQNGKQRKRFGRRVIFQEGFGGFDETWYYKLIGYIWRPLTLEGDGRAALDYPQLDAG